MPGPTSAPDSSRFRQPPVLIGLGILVVVVGFGLPRLFSGITADVAVPAERTQRGPGPAPSLATSTPLPPEPAPEKPGLGLAFARLFGGLVVVCALCVAVTRWLVKQTPPPRGAMEVVATLLIERRCAVHLVRAGERRLLIGTDIAGVKALTELPGRLPEELVDGKPIASKLTTPPGSSTGGTVVLGPVSMPVPHTTPVAATQSPPHTPRVPATPSPPAEHEEVLNLLARLRGLTLKSSPPPG